MPILMGLQNGGTDENAPYQWKAGQIVGVYDDNHEFGAKEIPSAGIYFWIGVTDKTLEEAKTYIEGWNHNPAIDQVARNGDNRLIEVTSDMVSASGKNAFTEAGVSELLSSINADYPTANATYQSHTNTSFRFSIVAPNSAYNELTERINIAVQSMQYARRRWYVTQAGMTALANNDWSVSGTASQVAGYLRDGLLD